MTIYLPTLDDLLGEFADTGVTVKVADLDEMLLAGSESFVKGDDDGWDEELGAHVESRPQLAKHREPVHLDRNQIEKMFGGYLDTAGEFREQLAKNLTRIFSQKS